MMSTGDRLVYMANQIARNFAIMGETQAARATADHIWSFWDPAMKQRIFSIARQGSAGLGAIAAQAIGLLESRAAIPAQSAATAFGGVHEGGGSDAG